MVQDFSESQLYVPLSACYRFDGRLPWLFSQTADDFLGKYTGFTRLLFAGVFFVLAGLLFFTA